MSPVLSRTLSPSKGKVDGTSQFQPLILPRRVAYLNLSKFHIRENSCHLWQRLLLLSSKMLNNSQEEE